MVCIPNSKNIFSKTSENQNLDHLDPKERTITDIPLKSGKGEAQKKKKERKKLKNIILCEIVSSLINNTDELSPVRMKLLWS